MMNFKCGIEDVEQIKVKQEEDLLSFAEIKCEEVSCKNLYLNERKHFSLSLSVITHS